MIVSPGIGGLHIIKDFNYMQTVQSSFPAEINDYSSCLEASAYILANHNIKVKTEV